MPTNPLIGALLLGFFILFIGYVSVYVLAGATPEINYNENSLTNITDVYADYLHGDGSNLTNIAGSGDLNTPWTENQDADGYNLIDLGDMTNYFGAACANGQGIQDIADDGTFSCEDNVTYAGRAVYANLADNLECIDCIDGDEINESGLAVVPLAADLSGCTNCIGGTEIDESSLGIVPSCTSWDSETSQGDLNVNSSNYWDARDTPSDIAFTDLTYCPDCINGTNIDESSLGEVPTAASATTAGTCTTWDGETSQGDLNVYSAGLWDALDTPADINAADITDDNTYATVNGETFAGIVDMGGNNVTNVADIEMDGHIFLDVGDFVAWTGTSGSITHNGTAFIMTG